MAATSAARSRSPSRSFSLSIAAALAVAASTASAQDDANSADVAAARELGIEGVRLADSGDCAGAIDRLARAEHMHHAPTTLERLGECQVKVGKIVEGTEALRRVVREALSPSAPPAFVGAQDRARQMLADAKPKIALLKIAVAAPHDAEFSLKVDGEAVPLANLNANRPMDPGEHVIEASGPRLLPARAKVKLAEGGSDSVALTLQIDPNAPPVPVATPPGGIGGSVGAPPNGEHGGSSNHTAAYVAFGVGGAALVVGAAFGVAALSAQSNLQTACPGKVCPASEQNSLDSAKTKGTISTIGFAVGGVGVALGVTFYFTHFFSRDPATTGGYVQPYLSAGGGGFRGAF
jgi:hypothetical protein